MLIGAPESSFDLPRTITTWSTIRALEQQCHHPQRVTFDHFDGVAPPVYGQNRFSNTRSGQAGAGSGDEELFGVAGWRPER